MNLLFKIAYGLVIFAVVALGILLLASRMPIPGNYQVKIVQSGSMEPAIKTGSIVVIQPREQYVVGDVVTFGKDTPRDVPTTHRIIAEEIQRGALLYTTKGDANEDADLALVAPSSIVGKVLFSIPYVGYLLDVARTPWGFWVLIGIPAGFVIFDEGMNIYREVRKRKEGEVVASDAETPS